MRALVTAVAAAACSMLALPAGASPSAGTQSRLTLPGTLTLSGSSSGVVHVHVPRDTSIDLSPTGDDHNGKDVTIGGIGRFVGAVIEQHVRKDKRYEPGNRTVYAMRYSVCGTPTCKSPTFYDALYFDPATHKFSLRPTLPAGDYDIFLVADGNPTTVTLRFHGLSGSRSLAPAHLPHTVQWSPDVRNEQIVMGHGARTTSGERGLVVDGPSAVVLVHLQYTDEMQRHATLCLQQNSSEASYTTPAEDCARGLEDGRTVAGAFHGGSVTCIGLCMVGLEDDSFGHGSKFFTEVDKLLGARLLGESQAQGHFGYETSNVLVLPW